MTFKQFKSKYKKIVENKILPALAELESLCEVMDDSEICVFQEQISADIEAVLLNDEERPFDLGEITFVDINERIEELLNFEETEETELEDDYEM